MEKLPARIEKYQPEGENVWFEKNNNKQKLAMSLFRVTHYGKVYGSPVAHDDDDV